VEEAAAASQAIASQAQALNGLVHRYHVGGMPDADSPRAKAPVAERRAKDRPWAKAPKGAPAPAPAPPRKAVVNDSAEWSEF
jgi:hypothetical protein